MEKAFPVIPDDHINNAMNNGVVESLSNQFQSVSIHT